MRKAMSRDFFAVLAVLFLVLFLPSFTTAAEELAHAGFLPGNIWYSKEPFFSGERIRVYTVLYNSSERDIVGEAIFFDRGKNIGTAAFSLAHGRVQDVWIDWTATKGSHDVYAELVNVRAGLPGEVLVPVALRQAQSGKSSREVDTDTDGDGIGDRDDVDDDNDGVPDADEVRAGTNPLAADSDADGLDDARDPQPLLAKDASVPESSESKISAAAVAKSLGSAGAALAHAAAAAAERLDDFRAQKAATSEARIEKLKALRASGAVAQDASKKPTPGTGVLGVGADYFGDTAGENAQSGELSRKADEKTTVPPLSPLQALAFYGNYALHGFFAWRVVFYGLLALGTWFTLKSGFRRIVRRL